MESALDVYGRTIEDLTYRPWVPDDVPFLWEMLYQSLHVRAGDEPFPRSVLDEPQIAHYLQVFGSLEGDDAEICVGATDQRLGAAWCRQLTSEDPGFGYVDDAIPELGMAVHADCRGRGIGRRLLLGLIDRHPALSLSVDDGNIHAAALYRSVGFVVVATCDGSTTMYRPDPRATAPPHDSSRGR